MDQSILFCNGLFILAWNSPAFTAPGSTFRISSPQPKLNYAHTLIDSLRLTRPGFRANLSLQLALDLHGVSLSHTSCYTHMRPPKSPPQQDISNVHLNRSLTKSTRTSVFFFFLQIRHDKSSTKSSWQVLCKVHHRKSSSGRSTTRPPDATQQDFKTERENKISARSTTTEHQKGPQN